MGELVARYPGSKRLGPMESAPTCRKKVVSVEPVQDPFNRWRGLAKDVTLSYVLPRLGTLNGGPHRLGPRTDCS